jgi:hypothetical protein
VALDALAAAPFLLAALARWSGWWPVGDDASIAWRSLDVLSRHSPLVGSVTLPGHGVTAFGLGPAEFWLLTVPVHLDPVHGTLWGAALWCAAAAVVAVEAVRAATGWPGALVAAGAVVLAAATLPAALGNLVWNPSFGIFWLLAAAGVGTAVAAGRLAWTPVLVVMASVVAQTHEVFAPPAFLILLGAVGAGILWRRRAAERLSGWWAPVAIGAGMACWWAPAVEQFTGRPGNLTVLSQAQGGPTLGLGHALGDLGWAVGPDPVWLRPLPHGGAVDTFAFTAGYFLHGALWGVLALALLAGAAILGWRRRVTWVFGSATVALLLAVGTVGALAAYPTVDFLKLSYLGAILWPVGLTAAVALVGAAALLLGPVWHSGARRSDALSRGHGLVLGVALGLGVALALLAAVSSDPPYPASETQLVHRSVEAADGLAPRRPFRLEVGGGQARPILRGAELLGVAYGLRVGGHQPELPWEGNQLGQDAAVRTGTASVLRFDPFGLGPEVALGDQGEVGRMHTVATRHRTAHP